MTGHDLQEMGIPPGPKMGEILNKLMDEQLEGRITDRKGAIEYAKSIYNQ